MLGSERTCILVVHLEIEKGSLHVAELPMPGRAAALHSVVSTTATRSPNLSCTLPASYSFLQADHTRAMAKLWH